jgi:DNA-binding XRE family transcriptional regulator
VMVFFHLYVIDFKEGSFMKETHKLMREMRGKLHQQQLAQEINISRESISKYENKYTKIPVEVSRGLMKKFNNPHFAITLCQEYTGTGPVCLDGPNIDLHRSSLKEKALKDLEEALRNLRNTNFVKPLKNLTSYELHHLQETLNELTKTQTSIANLIANVCTESGISYVELWQQHYDSLQQSGYLKYKSE